MGALYRLIDFYRAQVELIWNWRRGRRQLLWRAVVSFVVATLALALTAWALPGLRIDTPLALAGAVITIGLLSALVRPVLLAVVAPISLTLMFLTALVFQVAAILAIGPLVPGFRLNGVTDAIIAAVVFAIVSSVLSWVLSLDTDDSYYSMLVRRLVARRTDVNRTTTPGLVIIQIDGLSHAVLEQQVNAGRVPVMSKLLNRNEHHLGRWTTLLPSQTSASQAGIMWGNNDGIPAFRWYEKDEKRLMVSNRAEDAEEIEARAREGRRGGPPRAAARRWREHRQPLLGGRRTLLPHPRDRAGTPTRDWARAAATSASSSARTGSSMPSSWASRKPRRRSSRPDVRGWRGSSRTWIAASPTRSSVPRQT